MTSEIPWLASHTSGFGQLSPADDLLHPDIDTDDFTQTETYWFNFYVPERKLSGAIYCWMHKKLNTCTSGVWIWRGVKSHHLLSEHFNVQAHLPYPVQVGATVTVPHIGLSYEVVEPLRTIDIHYRDPSSGTVVELRAQGVAPPAVRGNGHHFEQAMRMTGHIVLQGETIAVDSLTVRDRSWGQGRSEDPADHPPLNWAVGAFDQGRVAFNILACDDPAKHPEWEGVYSVKPQSVLRDGWLAVDGELRRLSNVSQLVTREDTAMLYPCGYACEFDDETGEHHRLTGRLVARSPWGVWPNLHSTFCLMEWTLDGLVGHGDLQDSFWIGHLQAFSPKS